MQLYNKYIVRNLFMPFIVLTLTLTAIIWLSQSLRFIDLIVNKGLDVTTFLYLSLLIVPSLLFIILPIAAFISVLVVYNRFINDSELIVFKAAGISRMGLTAPALVMAGFVALFSYFISFYLLPSSYREFKDTQAFIRNNYASVLLQEGVFSTPTKGLTVYIESRGKGGLLEGILVHDSRKPEKPVTMMAKEGRLVRTSNGPRFDLVNGNRQEIDKENGNLLMLDFDSYQLDLSVYTNENERGWRTPEERYINELFFPDDVSDSYKNKFIAEGHYRLVWPLFTFPLTFIALAALFSGQFNRRGQWKRILSSTIIAVIIVCLNLLFKGIAASKPIASIFLYLNLILSSGVCLYILLTNRIINNIPVIGYLSQQLSRFLKRRKTKEAK